MKDKVSSTLSDRVAVNHCVTDSLKKSLNPNILELHCNVHPLDSLANKSRSALKETGVRGKLFGRDCAVANLVHSLSKLRYKQGSGDPASFKLFFKQKGIPMSTFPRYVGNRLHILFHLSGVHFHLRDIMHHFLDKVCLERGGLAKSAADDITNPEILVHLRVLGLLGKTITGPWMKQFYSESTTNLGSTKELKSCIAFLENLSEEPSMLATSGKTLSYGIYF